MVYEDALTILSYASPYEVIIEAKNGKLLSSAANQGAQPGHPLFRSASIGDLLQVALKFILSELHDSIFCFIFQIGKSAKKRLFQADDFNNSMSSNCSSLQKTRSNATTLERKNTNSPKPPPNQKPDRVKKVTKSQMSPEQLKAQLEQKILEDHKQNLKAKNEKPMKVESETQKTENKFQKFGVKVLPMEQQKSPKSVEQNENNMNIERNSDIVLSIDEVDDNLRKSPESSPQKDGFVRQGSLTGSGIKRDANGIPQEIPNHMLNAAVAARKNRKSSVDKTLEKEEADAAKATPSKKQKGKAPAPPEEKSNKAERPQQHFDDIETVSETTSENIVNKSDDSLGNEKPPDESKETKDYNSDSDAETDNQSSVNTIELNSSDITIHQTEETEELQNRKTASTGDLSKIQKAAKSGTGTLERAQSLDITDTGIPTITKKRKTGRVDDGFDSDDDLYCSALINKEPRLSLILDGLNTFQRSRLKKSTEWGNLEDAILRLENESVSSSERFSLETPDGSRDRNFDFGAKSPEFDALVNKINEIKQETPEKLKEDEKVSEQVITRIVGNIEKTEEVKGKQVKNQIWPTVELQMNNGSGTVLANGSPKKPEVSKKKPVNVVQKHPEDEAITTKINKPQDTVSSTPEKPKVDLFALSKDFLFAERLASSIDEHKAPTISGETNVSDDMKVSRHSLGSLEAAPVSNVSSITINDKKISSFEISFKDPKDESTISDLYTTAIDDTLTLNNQSEIPERVTVRTPDFTNNINEVTIEGPTSLTLEIPGEITETQYSCLSSFSDDTPRSISVINKESGENEQCICPSTSNRRPEDSKNSSTLTFITEIQVTPNNSNSSSNVSEIEIIPNVNNSQNLDNKFENYVKNFEASVKAIESNYPPPRKPELKTPPVAEKIDAEKELHKIHEIVEEQLKKLPEMRFTTSSYESTTKIPEKRQSQSQVELLKSNFEKSPPKLTKSDSTVSKSRIPIATSTKTPPMSPERRDSRNLEFEPDKDILAIMSQSVHSTPATHGGLKYQSKSPNKNVTVTSIRSNSKIPSGLPSLNSGRPPVPPRKTESNDNDLGSMNGSSESSFKQWVFNPSNSVTNVVVTESKDQK